MTYTEFKEKVLSSISQYPSDWRKGQKVFNYIDEYYGVARKVQFEKHIDCFYDNSQINEFIEASYSILEENNML